MNSLALVHYHNQVLTWSSDIEGSRVLSHQLIHLVDESRILHEKRDSLLYGIEAITKNHVTFKIFDEYGLAASGKEYIRFRAHYHMLPHPKINESYNSFETVTENVLNLVRILKVNCTELRVRLETMRTIMEEAQNGNYCISDTLQNLYLNCEKLYCGIQFDIGFLANIVQVG
jgi:hypothetical protein